jgi:hypothetical protein
VVAHGARKLVVGAYGMEGSSFDACAGRMEAIARGCHPRGAPVEFGLGDPHVRRRRRRRSLGWNIRGGPRPRATETPKRESNGNASKDRGPAFHGWLSSHNACRCGDWQRGPARRSQHAAFARSRNLCALEARAPCASNASSSARDHFDPMLGCPSSTTCGEGCDFAVGGSCTPSPL